MTEPTRRTVLGAAGALGSAAVLGAGSPSAHAAPAPGPQPPDLAPAAEAVARLLPRHAAQFRFTALPAATADRFRVSGRSGDIEVAASGPGVALTAVHWYLKYVCDAHISWSGSHLEHLPDRLPAPAAPLERAATVANRFALNDTHDGYTGPYHDWNGWERLIDVLALHGVNQALVTPGQEAVYHRLLQDFGYSDDEARAWIPAPSHQPWWLLQNLSGFGGPVSHAGLARRVELGQKIVRRMRELGISPVMPGYFGTVPEDFAARNAGSRTVPQGTWNMLQRPPWLDPRTGHFAEVAASFYRHQAELFGPATHFKMDLLHEGGTPGDVPVPTAAQAVETALQTARPGAVWVILGWQANPRRELVDAIDKSRMLVVDGLSDIDTVTDREKDWNGTPYAFGTIPNFGGRTTIGAKAHNWTARFTAWRDKPGSALVGTAYMPEATDRDPAAFELFSELAWHEDAIDRDDWFAGYARFRYGADPGGRAAAAALKGTAYELRSADGRPYDSIFTGRPGLTTAGTTYDGAFDQPDFDKALVGLLGVAEGLRDSDAYKHDLVDFARQSVADRSRLLLPQLRLAYQDKDLETFRRLSGLWLRLMGLAAEVSGGHRSFLTGRWLEEAKRFATSAEEGADFEWTARVLLSTWAYRATADPGTGALADYANRDWQGVYEDLYLPRWQRFLQEYEDALAQGREPQAIDWYLIEEAWTRQTTNYPVRPTVDPLRAARHAAEVLATAPYQGSLTVVTDPPVLNPGATGELRAVFRNETGFAPTGRVDLTLTGLTPGGTRTADAVAPAGRAAVSWPVQAPDVPLERPLQHQPYELRVAYGPAGQDRVALTRTGNYFLAGPLGEGWRTASNNAAVFGQLGDRFAIEGAGKDLWKGNCEYGAVYREGELRDGTAVTVRVDHQDATANWARCGIIVRNSLADFASLGFLNLSVTPANGVVLSYDTNGDGTVDTYKRITGITTPVTLRLTRVGSSFRGECSTDDGVTWRTVATVPVTGVAAVQDVGLVMSAVTGGSGVRGLTEFSGWRLG
ncbi:alpha-N-acetylglucosaminidase [Streptomyces sp. NPDC051940]|uniref:alpha-N-acetylglucosaminidase n=1 Tax=Streptomyces sp. NPDC051940 TaxID=3155675 RepID=UPI00341500B5